MYALLFYILGWVVGVTLMYTSTRHHNPVLYLLSGHMIMSVGMGFIFRGITHIFRGPAKGPYVTGPISAARRQAGFAALGIGLCALIAPRFGLSFTLAVIIITAFYLWGTVLALLCEKKTKKAPRGLPAEIAADILIPLTVLVLWYLEASKWFFLFGHQG